MNVKEHLSLFKCSCKCERGQSADIAEAELRQQTICSQWRVILTQVTLPATARLHRELLI